MQLSTVLSLLVALPLLCTRTRGGSAPSPPDISPSKIALLHMSDDVWFFRELGSVTLRNKRRYAARHGYELVVHTHGETSGLFAPAACDAAGAVRRGDACYARDGTFVLDRRAPTFGKIKLAIAACVARDDYWLLWTDADALIVNQARRLVDVVDDAYDVMVASDWFMINAGVLLLRCSQWNVDLLKRVYAAREFDTARALDQSALSEFFSHDDVKDHVKHVPKWLINVYTEEYVPGDFIVHFAGKLYEATPVGIAAIARQYDVLSRVDDVEKVASFFSTRYLLGYYSGTCVMGDAAHDPERQCLPGDARRLRLDEPLGAFSSPARYHQLQFRSPRHKDWTDPNDVPGRADPVTPRVAPP